MLYFLTEHTLIIYVQYMKDYKRKTSYLLEKLFEKELVHFVSDSIFKRLKGALAWYGKLTWESTHAWILINSMLFNCLGITFIFMVRLSCYAIPLLIYDVINDITIMP